MNQGTLLSINTELYFAREKFPGNKHTMAALTEEVGELAQALLDRDYGKKLDSHVRSEAIQVAAMAIQVAAMAIRILEEGDSTFSFVPCGIKE